jgi:glyceraldehyde 3-phosphate dehydrogenase
MGRLALRAGWGGPDLTFAHVNEVAGDAATAAHLLTFDSIHGRFDHDATGAGESLTIDGMAIAYSGIADPAEVPWDEHGVEVVLECTGRFRTREALAAYFGRGVRKVIVAAPVKQGALNVVVGVNEDRYDPALHDLLTAASCTTNCLAPMAKALNDEFGIVKGLMTTIHAYTNDQVILDFMHKDLRRARAAAQNIIPTTTGAARATALVLPELKGKLDGMAMRVPVVDGSVTDLVVQVGREVTVDEVNAAYRAAADGPLKGYLHYTSDPIVSSDIVGTPYSCTFDSELTMTFGDQVKVIGWYDNEWGYSSRLVDVTALVGGRLG